MYSLWIIPPEPLYSNLTKTILQLSRCYSAPMFEPHVTLLGEIDATLQDMQEKASLLASNIPPFTICIHSIQYTNEYYKCLYIKARRTKEIMNANFEARRIFNQKSNTSFLPHLSILYGYYDPAIKDNIVAEVGERFHTKFLVRSFYISSGSSDNDTSNWKILADIPLTCRP